MTDFSRRSTKQRRLSAAQDNHTLTKPSSLSRATRPDYALWYGWSEMQRDLTEIQELAAEAAGSDTLPPLT